MTPAEMAAAMAGDANKRAEIQDAIPANITLTAEEVEEIIKHCWDAPSIPECVAKMIAKIMRRKEINIDSPGF